MACELHARVVLTSFLMSLSAWKVAVATSCAGDTCTSALGPAMLQVSKHSALKVNDAAGGSDAVASRTHCGLQTSPMSATEQQYKAVKESCCLYAMAEFVKVAAQTHRPRAPHMNYTICGAGFAPGVAVWHGCDGVGKDRTFNDLLEQIVSHADTPCAAIAKKGETCQPRLGCPNYAGTPPKDCGCSRSNSVALDFANARITANNLGGDGPDTTAARMIRYEAIGTYGDGDDEITIHLEVKQSAGSRYTNGNPARNGKSGDFGAIALDLNTNAKFTFTFKDDSGLEVPIDELAFTIIDIDGGASQTQYLRASDISGYVIEGDTDLSVSSDDGEFFFEADPPAGERSNPTSLDLTPDQRKVSVMLLYKNVASFELEFGIDGTATHRAQRQFRFAGMTSMGDHCAA